MTAVLEKPRQRVNLAKELDDAIATLRDRAAPARGLTLLHLQVLARLVSIADQHMQRERLDDAVRILLGIVHRALRNGQDVEAVRAELQRLGTAAIAPHMGLPGAIDLFKLAKLDPKPTAVA